MGHHLGVSACPVFMTSMVTARVLCRICLQFSRWFRWDLVFGEGRESTWGHIRGLSGPCTCGPCPPGWGRLSGVSLAGGLSCPPHVDLLEGCHHAQPTNQESRSISLRGGVHGNAELPLLPIPIVLHLGCSPMWLHSCLSRCSSVGTRGLQWAPVSLAHPRGCSLPSTSFPSDMTRFIP